MRVKLFWKNNRRTLNELYKDGTLKRFSFKNVKDSWKDWWSGKNEPGCSSDGWLDDLSIRKSQDLEDEVNAWLLQNPGIKVVDIKQSTSGGSYMSSMWLISVWYEESA
jgi:hypothetical protein